ncbi:MAG: hypothetical protein OEU26_19215 [Candidatus Tectomicrobia bacterium]|nr:hypothetical protein [Candidatus Tectomicrobia bacterium]
MGEEFLGDRRKALEDAFFAKHNEELKQKLREAESARAKRDALRTASGIADEAVLNQLIALDVQSETVAALSLIPLLDVAWADGRIDTQERQAILAGAQTAGLQAGSASYQLLEGWLHQRPAPALFTAWQAYVQALAATLDADDREALKSELLGRARTVADAAGGILGLGNRISRAEQDRLTALEQAFA